MFEKSCARLKQFVKVSPETRADSIDSFVSSLLSDIYREYVEVEVSLELAALWVDCNRQTASVVFCIF